MRIVTGPLTAQERALWGGIGVGMFLLAIAIARAWPEAPGPVGLLVLATVIAGPMLTWKMLVNKPFFCTDCGQFLGKRWDGPPRPCARCGCNVYTDKPVEAGHKIRHR
jgi:hypothetical protein